MFRYFVFDSSVIIGLLEEPFVSGGTCVQYVVFFCKLPPPLEI